MPSAAIAPIGNFLLAVFGGTSAAATAAAYLTAELFVYAATNYLLTRAAQALAPKPRAKAGLGQGTEVNYTSTRASVRIIYGQVKIGGMETIPPITQSKPNSNAFEDLFKILTVAGHEIDSYNFTHFDTTTIDNTQIGPMAFTMSDGLVSSGTYKDHLFIRYYRGTSTDSADRMLCSINSSIWGNARARGIAKVAMTLRYNADVYKSMPTITFTLQGKRVYDPRLDAGGAGANPTNTTYIVYSSNPALCLADYLMSFLGGEYDPTDIDWDTVVTAANYCDGLVNIPGALTQARYTCNGVLFATDDFLDNVKLLADSMLGRVMFRDGKWRMYAGSWQTPTFTVNVNDWISPMKVRFEQGSKKRFNRMRVHYVDPAREWQENECIPRSNATYRTADGGRLFEVETEQLLCTNEYEAQRKGEFLLRASRNQIAPTGKLGPKHGDIALWDTGTIVDDELGWSSKTFRVIGVDRHPDGSADYVFNEEQSTDWTDPVSGDYFQPSTTALPAPNVTTPTEPLAFSVTPQVNGTLLFQWNDPIVKPAGTKFQIIRATNSIDASVGTVVWEGNASPVPLVMPVSAHWYWVRGTVPGSGIGAYQPNTFGVFAIPRLESDHTLQNRLAGDAEFAYGAASSLWMSGNIFSVVSGLPSATELFNNVSTLAATSYSPTGGQFGGFMNFQKRNGITHTQGQDYPCLFTVNPQNSIGYPANNQPFAVQYTVRFRINSRPNGTIGGEQFGIAIGRRFTTPASGFPTQLLYINGLMSVKSADATLGVWTHLQRTKVVEPLDLNVSSASQVHACGLLYSNCTSGVNIDIDYFQIEPLGWLNYPVDVRTGGPLREFHSMYNSVPNNDCEFRFPVDGDYSITGNWPKFAHGRRFVLNKISTTSACFIVPSSGMTLRLAGRSAVGTVTMVQTLPATAVIENINGTEYLVTGVGLQ